MPPSMAGGVAPFGHPNSWLHKQILSFNFCLWLKL